MTDLKVAMKSGDKQRVTALRNIIAKIKAIQIDTGETLSDEGAQKVLLSYSKQLKDSISQFRNANREDLVEKESAELLIVEGYLPEQLSEEEIKHIVQKIISDAGASTMADMGKVMPQVMAAIAGKGDGKIAAAFVREQLSG